MENTLIKLRGLILVALLIQLPLCRGDKYGDYSVVPGVGAYRIHVERTGWRDAWLLCNSEKGYLMVINNQDEANALKPLVKDFAKFNVGHMTLSVGFHSMFAENYWTTIFGEPVEFLYNMWAVGEPDKPDEKCGGINYNVEMVSIPCQYYNISFICEKPLASSL